MKVLVFVKATPNSEKGALPDDDKLQQMLADMGAFNEKLVKAGVMQEADGLKPSSAGKRITFSDQGHTAVIDGPFIETKELVAGYWIWNVKSMDEAVAWAKQCPNPMPGEEGVLEIRPTWSVEEFDELIGGEGVLREQDARLRKQIKRQKKAKKKVAPKKRKARRAKAKRARAKK